jgi:hypothetical protein
VVGYEPDVKSEKDEKFLILLPNTVVDPGAVVVHLLNAPVTEMG